MKIGNSAKEGTAFRGLDDAFIEELEEGKLQYILDFERKHRKSFMVEIRDNFLDLYFLGHTIEVKRREDGYYFTASSSFIPQKLSKRSQRLVEKYSAGKWQIKADKISSREQFDEIMTAVLAEIVRHKKGMISEGVSELNHFIDNRSIGRNGILVIDRQVVYPGRKECRIDLLGLKRIATAGNVFSFVVIELKNKNNVDIGKVCTQTKKYIDLIYDNAECYERFRLTYEKVLEQKIKLRLLKPINCRLASREEVAKKDILGLVVLDNFNIKSDCRKDGLLARALKDWDGLGEDYLIQLFLKTNVLDSTFFMNKEKAAALLASYKKCNS